MQLERKQRTGLAPVRFALAVGAVASLAAAPIPLAAPAQAAATVVSDHGVGDFYDQRGGHSLWFQPGQAGAAAKLLELIQTAGHDGLDPKDYDPKALARALRKAAKGDRDDIRRADQLLSKAFVAYARDLRDAPAAGMEFVDPRARPPAPSPRALLLMAASAPSLTQFLESMSWMHPYYAPLRRALVSGQYRNAREAQLLRINLERARVLPATFPRFVIVNAADQKLYMYEGGRIADEMNVVVGKQKAKDRTPMMASLIREAALNPYWNVPPDLAAERIAPNVIKEGVSYLKKRGYQVLSDWGERPAVLDPETIDWKAVAEGRIEVRLRQLPGPGNSLGKVKFSFPNRHGVYLHDTPEKALLSEDTRLFSGGCIRLEDADRFGQWLFGRALKATSKAPEIEVALERPVPIYVTYLTAVPRGGSVAFLDDVYGWDSERLAERGSSGRIAAR